MRILIMTILTFTMSTIQAQNLEKHQWENRVVLIIADDTENKLYRNQANILLKYPYELIDRKLIIYGVTPSQSSILFSPQGNKQELWKNATIFNRYNANKGYFKVILLGLDGGIKVQQQKIIDKDELFRIIDSMPMRASEIRRKGNF